MSSQANTLQSSNSSFLSISSIPSITSSAASTVTEGDEQPPPYSAVVQADASSSWNNRDPRSSSTQSLNSSEFRSQDRRRRLLLIYIHGFMGDETSFQSFPAHVHNLVSALLSESHTVHTKIYPRYRSKNNISVAAHDLSRWLYPHESQNTDTILLGHSLGGLVAAETALIPSDQPSASPFRHRLLGTVSFDSPFLGMHTGVIKSGLGSLFNPSPTPPRSPQLERPPSNSSSTGRADTFTQNRPSDPNFNPSFPNDVLLPVRSGWKNAFHFINKHSDNLLKSTTTLLKSHYEFGACLSDFDGLKVRYGRIRTLEEEDQRTRASVVDGAAIPPRVRFVNYYSSCTGRPKKPQESTNDNNPNASSEGHGSLLVHESSNHSQASTPRDNDVDDAVSVSSCSSFSSIESELEELEPLPSNDTDSSITTSTTPSDSRLSVAGSFSEPPQRPGPPPSKTDFPDKVAYRQAMRNHGREILKYAQNLKAYHRHIKVSQQQQSGLAKANQKMELKDLQENAKVELQAIKADQKSLSHAGNAQEKKQEFERMAQRRKKEYDAQKQELKRQAQLVKEKRKAEKDMTKKEQKEDKQKLKEDAKRLKHLYRKECGKSKKSSPQSTPDREEVSEQQSSTAKNAEDSGDTKSDITVTKPVKEKHFCNLPAKDSAGARDKAWRRVFMEGVDEVGAHCGLFFPQGASTADKEQAEFASQNGWGDRYARLVGDVSENIEGWVHDYMTEAMIRGVQQI